MKTLRTVIIDDEPDCIHTLVEELKAYCPEVRILKTCISGKEGLKTLQHLKPDLVFLDIEMPWMDGFELLHCLKEIPFHVIFVTAYNQYAVKAFRLNAVDYLLKPTSINELREAVDKVLERQEYRLTHERLATITRLIEEDRMTSEWWISIPTKEGLHLLQQENILYLEADGNYCRIHTTDGKEYYVSRPMKNLIDNLHQQMFLRIHNSYLVQVRRILKYYKGNGGYVQLEGDVSLPVSRARKKAVLSTLNPI